jgi:predicted phage tail protein
VTIQWSGPSSDGGAPVTGYKIYRGADPGSTTLIKTVGGNNNSYSDQGLTNGQTYYYRVSAVNRVGEGPFSPAASAKPSSGPSVPATPQSLAATAAVGAVTLQWSAPASDGGNPILNYTIYRGTSPSSLSVLTSGAKSRSLFDGGVTNGVTYYYAVAAVNGIGEGPRSPPVSATPKGTGSGTDNTRPTIGITSPAPGAVVATGPVTVAGTASDNVGLALVEVSTDQANWTLASGTASWTATLNLTPGQHTIFARAMDGSGNSADATITVVVSSDAGTPAGAGGDIPRSLIVTAVLSFAIAAGGAWFVLDRRRRGSAPPQQRPKPPSSPSAGPVVAPTIRIYSPPSANGGSGTSSPKYSSPKIMGRWRK